MSERDTNPRLPLKKRSIAYLKKEGARLAEQLYEKGKVWWLVYFTQANGFPLPLLAEHREGVRRRPELFLRFIASEPHELWRYPQRVGEPWWMSRPIDYQPMWQAETAFRMGFMNAYEQFFVDDFAGSLREHLARNNSEVDQQLVDDLSREFENDPGLVHALRPMLHFYKAGHYLLEGRNSLRALYMDLMYMRQRSTNEAFSPFLRPMSWQDIKYPAPQEGEVWRYERAKRRKKSW